MVDGDDQGHSALLPLFLKLAGRRVVVVGGGPVAAAKIRALGDTGAEVLVVAPGMHPDIRNEASPGRALELAERAFVAGDLDGAWLAIAAAPPAVNRQVAAAAAERRIFVVAVDDPATASAYGGGTLRRAGLTIAISTDGQAPALAGLLREGLEAVIPGEGEVVAWIERARALRAGWRDGGVPMEERRPQLLAALNQLYAAKAQT